MKPGYRTTEFWLSAVSSLLAFLVAVGLVSQADLKHLESSLASVIGATGSLLGGVWAIVAYIQSRTEAKVSNDQATVAHRDIERQEIADAQFVEDPDDDEDEVAY